jgi:hypothetical protein
MNVKFLTFLLVAIAMLSMIAVSPAEAAVGSLSYTFKYKNPATGIDQNLSRSWVYLRSTANPPPMEKYFSRADHILWGSFGNGTYRITNIPEGTYYIRITERKFRTGDEYWLGPPEEGDYTWFQTMPITITANQELQLGTLYALPFAASPITITGTVKDINGVPLANQYVRAQTEPCLGGDADHPDEPNQCGPVKKMALQRTDAQGRYTMELREPGTYYFYATGTLYQGPYNGYSYPGTGAPGPIAVAAYTVTVGETKTVDITKLVNAP